VDYVGGSEIAGWELRSPSSYWDHFGDEIVVGADDYGFSALPGGRRFTRSRDSALIFADEGRNAYWWSSTENRPDYFVDQVWCWGTIYSTEEMSRHTFSKSNLNSVRCVKD
jgi:uncharacterized protein (TIGR02145 family)